MKLKCIQDEREYVRTIEKMGERLVLFKTSVVNKGKGMYYHFGFEDNRKPPMDLAINPNSGIVEYVSCFAMGEKLVVRTVKNDIDYKDGMVIIEDVSVDEQHFDLGWHSFEKKFEIVISNNDIFILDEELFSESLQAYRIDKSNYLLFSNDSEFRGILLKNITEKEWEEIRNTQCFS